MSELLRGRDFDTRRKGGCVGSGQSRGIGRRQRRTGSNPWRGIGRRTGGARPRVFCKPGGLAGPEALRVAGRLLGLIELTPNLDWLLLTKRPQLWRRSVCGVRDACEKRSAFHLGSGYGIASQWIDNIPPENVWFGVTVEDQASADKRAFRCCWRFRRGCGFELRAVAGASGFGIELCKVRLWWAALEKPLGQVARDGQTGFSQSWMLG